MRLLLIEDDPMIGKAVREGLRSAGFAVDWVVDGRSAEASLADPGYALALLDLGLPSQDGMQLLRKLRAGGTTLPVLIASARDAVGDRIAGRDAGPDDYVTKPADLEQLIAPVHALLRRPAGAPNPLHRSGALLPDPVRRRVT